jgi:ribonuclease-3
MQSDSGINPELPADATAEAGFPPESDCVEKLEARIGHRFQTRKLLVEALTHRSYRAERGLDYDNQRLELLGDAVVQIVLTEYLFHRYTEDDEGRLTRMRASLVQRETLANFARIIGLGNFLRLGRGENDTGGRQRDSILCDAFESLIGAIHLDVGFDGVRKVLLPLVEKHGESPSDLLSDHNPKGLLQEYTQKRFGVAPVYRLEAVEGPEHTPLYTVSVLIRDENLGTGEGRSRKIAEGNAAKAALRRFQQIST